METPILFALLSAGTLCLHTVRAESLVFEIGTFDNSPAEFEQEGNNYNDAQYYWEPGGYTETSGRSGWGTIYENPEPEILQDGPTVDTWADSFDGFPRALTSGRPVIDIFFQLTASEAASEALLFETELIQPGTNSSHNLTFYFNNIPVHSLINIRAAHSVQLYIPANLPGISFVEGPNVLSIVRTGGGTANPYIQFDALRLTAELSAPPQPPLWQVGHFDNSQADFEPESNAFNNPQYYTAAGDYTETIGQAGPGGVWESPEPEIWKDASDDSAETLDGFPRALVPGRPVIDIFFQLTAEQAQQDYLAFSTVLFSLGANSAHHVKFYLNGVPFYVGTNLSATTPVDVLIPRRGVLSTRIGAPFHVGPNVLSLTRVGGAPFDPLVTTVLGDGRKAPVNEPWIQFDAVKLELAPPPNERPATLSVYDEIFVIGHPDNNQEDFEHENDLYNNPQYYAAAGNYKKTIGSAGVGGIWESPEPEIWQDTGDDWAATLDGFPRALRPGRPIIDIFFQLDERARQARRFTFLASLYGLGIGSSHDVEFYFNGKPIFSRVGIIRNWGVAVELSPEDPDLHFLPGPNVISLVRIGGGSEEPWIQFDTVQLLAEHEVSTRTTPPAETFAITSVTRSATGEISLTWASVAGAEYRVDISTTLAAGSWTPLASNLAGMATSTSYTDSAIPAGATPRFYRVIRTR